MLLISQEVQILLAEIKKKQVLQYKITKNLKNVNKNIDSFGSC